MPDPWSDLNQKVQDLTSIRDFTEQYVYDANSNLTSLKHLWDATTKYHRQFGVETNNNRLNDLTIGATTYTYQYDAAGNLTQENTERKMTWDYADRMRVFRNQVSGSEASVFAQYLYDAAGERVMKVVSKSGTDDVITTYIDGFFEHREHRKTGGTTANDELHIQAGQNRVARLRVGTAFSNDNSPATIYCLTDHLGSGAFTLQNDGSFFSREEYTPYGESAYGSYEKKRYRFTGKEKDEESGLHYHGARYYAPWLGRWTAADPAGMNDGPDLYSYSAGSPIDRIDQDGRESAPASEASEIVSGAVTTAAARTGVTYASGTAGSAAAGSATAISARRSSRVWSRTPIYVDRYSFEKLQMAVDPSGKNLRTAKLTESDRKMLKELPQSELDSLRAIEMNLARPKVDDLWMGIREISLRGGPLVVMGVPFDEPVSHHVASDASSLSTAQSASRSLKNMSGAGANAVTLPTPTIASKVAEKASEFSRSESFVLSPHESVSRVYLRLPVSIEEASDPKELGAAALSTNERSQAATAAHEVLGHFLLATRGVEFRHAPDVELGGEKQKHPFWRFRTPMKVPGSSKFTTKPDVFIRGVQREAYRR